MVKLLFLCRRRPDITHDRYAELLLDGHVPIALAHHPAMRRYVVNLVDQSPPGEVAFDSIGELSFDSLQDYQERLYDSPAGRQIVERDVRGFMGTAYAYATTEHVQKSGPPGAATGTRSPGIKLICPLLRRTGMSHADFVDHWLTRHVPLALRHRRGLTCYVTNVVDAQLSATGVAWDGIAELHFASAAALHDGLFDSDAGERIIREETGRFIERAAPYWVGEYVHKVPA